jgi:hypothetical protein
VLSVFSSRRNWDSPNPPPERHSLAREGLGVSQFRREDIQYTLVLFVYTYFVLCPLLTLSFPAPPPLYLPHSPLPPAPVREYCDLCSVHGLVDNLKLTIFQPPGYQSEPFSSQQKTREKSLQLFVQAKINVKYFWLIY